MSKYRRVTNSCAYKGLIDGSLLRSARRNIDDKNVHQLIVNGPNVAIDGVPHVHRSDAFLIGIVNYLPGEPGIHTNHAVSAILTNGRLYCFNAHGIDSQPMGWLRPFLTSHGLTVTDFIQYSGPNLQALDTRGACTAFSYRFLRLHPNASMDQERFNEYVVRELTKYTLGELYMYLNTVSSIRNTGVVSSNNNNNNNRRNNKNNKNNKMNITRARVVRARRPRNNRTNMDIN